MRTPGPRLRQVFEHTTSFKVKKPSGETITIAKKGLSPSTVGRLRRFAQGGEVRNYQVGGQVAEPEPTETEGEMSAAAGEAARQGMAQEAAALPEVQLPAVDSKAPGIEAVRPAGLRRVVKAEDAKAADSATQEKQFLDYAKYLASRPEKPAAMTPFALAAPVAQPPTVIINNTPAPAPTAPQQAMTAASTAMGPAPVSVATEPTPATDPTTSTESQQLTPADAFPTEVAPAGDLASSVFTPRQLQSLENFKRGARAQADAAAVPLEQEQSVFTPLQLQSLENFKAGAKALRDKQSTESNASDQAGLPVAGNNEPLSVPLATSAEPGPATPVAAVPVSDSAPRVATPPAYSHRPPTLAPDILTDEQIDALVAPAPERYRPALKMAMQSQRNTELADRQLRAQQVSAVKAEEDRTRAAAELAKNKVEEVRNKKYEILSQLEAARQEGTFFSKMPALEKIGTILMMGVSGYLSGYSGVPNYALDAFNKALARDIERQRQKSQGLLVELKAMTGSEQVAEQMYRGIAKEAISIEAKRQEMQASSDKARSAYGAVSAKFALDAYKDFADIDQKVADTAYTEARRLGELTAPEKLAIEASKAANRERIANLEQERIQESARAHRVAEKAARENAADKDDLDRQARTLNAGGIGLLMPRKAQGTKVQQQLMFRNQGIRAIDSAIDLLDKANNVSLATKNSDEYIAATALVKSLKESYAGLAQGAERAISLNAAKVVEEALQNPTSLTRLVLGQKTTALRELRREFDGARTGFVRSMTLPGENVDAAIKALHEEDAFISGVSADKLIDFQPGAK